MSIFSLYKSKKIAISQPPVIDGERSVFCGWKKGQFTWQNLIINYVILYVTTLLKKIKVSYFRILLSAICGSVYAIVSIIVSDNIISKIILSIVMILIIYPTKDIRKFLETLAIFYLVSITTGGASIAISYLVNGYKINTVNGATIVDFPILFSSIGLILGIILIKITINNVKSKITQKNIFYDIEVFIGNKRTKIKALLDTGNMLKEPISNMPVVVIERVLLYNCVPKEILNNLDSIMGGDFEKVPDRIQKEYISKLKLIPFASLGKSNGMLIGIKPEYLKIIKKDETIEEKNIILGIYQQSLTKKGEYQALMGMEFI